MKKMMKVLSMLMLALLLSIGTVSAKTTTSVYELESLYTSRFTIKGSRLYVTTVYEPIKKLGKTRWNGTRLCGFKKTFKIIAASIIMYIAIIIMQMINFTDNVYIQTFISVISGVAIYAALIALLKVITIKEIKSIIYRGH